MAGRRHGTGSPKSTWVLRTISGLAYMAFAASLSSQVSPVGPEFQVNTYVDGVQHGPSVDFDAAGNFVVIWYDEYWDFVRNYLDRPRARKFSPDGQAAGPDLALDEFKISWAAALAVQDGGEFVVARSYQEGYFSGHSDVKARLFDSQGALTTEFRVNSLTGGYRFSTSVAATPGAGFLVVWESEASAGTDHSGTSVQAREFTAAGAPVSEDFQINSYTPGRQSEPQVAVQPAGDFVVVWQTAGPIDGDASGLGIRAQRFNSVGSPVSAEFQVNGYTLGEQSAPVVATLADGGFVIAWQSAGSSGGDNSGLSVQARLYSASGAPLAGEFQVNSYTTGDQLAPAVAADSTGTFAIAWTSNGSSGSDSSSLSVQARRYRADGRALTDEFQVNSYTSAHQLSPAISFSPNGDFVVSWESYGSTGGDASRESIQARQFQGLFADGFESGTMQRWSPAVE
jgi:hypothetical protein